MMLTAIVLCAATSAFAGSMAAYTGSDDGASTSGPRPNASAAQTQFLAAAFPTTLVNFENVPLGHYAPIVPNSTVSIAIIPRAYCETNIGCTRAAVGALVTTLKATTVPEPASGCPTLTTAGASTQRFRAATSVPDGGTAQKGSRDQHETVS